MLPEGATWGVTEERAEKLLERREQALQEGATAVVTGGGERWRDQKGDRRSYGRGQEKALPEEKRAKGAKTGRQR